MNEIKLNERTHLLQEEPYSYQLQDVEEPNLMREFFEYTEIPKFRSTSGGAVQYAGEYMDYGYHFPGRTAVSGAVYRAADCGYLQNDFQTVRTEWHYPADGVFCIQRPGPGGHREVHGPGIEVPGDHHVDSGEEGGL